MSNSFLQKKSDVGAVFNAIFAYFLAFCVLFRAHGNGYGSILRNASGNLSCSTPCITILPSGAMSTVIGIETTP